MKKENVSSQIDDTNQIFTLSEAYKAGSLRVYWNGVRQIVSVTFTETTSTTFTTSFTAQIGDYLTVDYTPV